MTAADPKKTDIGLAGHRRFTAPALTNNQKAAKLLIYGRVPHLVRPPSGESATMGRYAIAVFTAALLMSALPVRADNWSDLRGAVYYGKQSEVARLLDSGIDINLSNEEGWTALHVAAEQGDVKLVNYLLDRGADPNRLTARGQTAFDVSEGYGEVRQALKAGMANSTGASAASKQAGSAARAQTSASAGDEARVFAAYQQAVAANPELSRLRAQVQDGGAAAAIPRLLTYTEGHPGSAEAWYLLAVAHGRANQEEVGMSALARAVRLKPEMNSLLDSAMRQRLSATAPAGPTSRNGPNDGRTASTRARLEARDAVWYNNPGELTALLNAGLNVNALDESGRETLLHAAAGRDRVQIARLLLARGADKSIADKDGKLPVDYAQSPEMRALLGGAKRSAAPPPKPEEQHCKAMWHEATALCGVGNSSCNTSAHIRYQSCLKKGTWY